MDWKKALVGIAPFALGVVGYVFYRKAKATITPDPAEIPGTAGPILSVKSGIMVEPSNDTNLENAANVVTAADEQPVGTIDVTEPPQEEPVTAPAETTTPTTETSEETEATEPAVVAVPFQPYGLTCPEVSTSGAWDLEWNPVENASRYSVRESANGGDWKVLYQGPNTKFPVKGRSVGRYSYSVTAWNSDGKASVPSDVVTCKVIAAPKMEQATDTEDLVRIILTDGQAYGHPTALDDWVKNNVAKMSDSADVYRILALAGGTTSLEGA